MTKFIKIGVLCFVAFIGYSLISDILGPEKMLRYLENKYDKEFVIENLEDLTLAERTSDKLIAHPKGEKDLPFLVYYDNQDTYLLSIWEQEVKEELTSAMENIFGFEVPFNVSILMRNDMYDMSHFDMSFSDYVKDVNQSGFLIIVLALPSIYEPEDYADEIYQVFQLLELYGMDSYSVSTGFVDDDFDTEEYLRTAGISNIGWSNFYKGVKGHLIINDLSKIETLSDIIDNYQENTYYES